MQYINEGKYFGKGEKDSINSHVSSRMIYGMNLDNETKKLLFCLNTVVHEIGHVIDDYSIEKLAYTENGYQKALEIVEKTGIEPDPNIFMGRSRYYTWEERLGKSFSLFKKKKEIHYIQDVS